MHFLVTSGQMTQHILHLVHFTILRIDTNNDIFFSRFSCKKILKHFLACKMSFKGNKTIGSFVNTTKHIYIFNNYKLCSAEMCSSECSE